METPCIKITDSIKQPGWYLVVYGEDGTILTTTSGNYDSDPFIFISKLREALDTGEIIDSRKSDMNNLKNQNTELRNYIEDNEPPANNFTDGL